MGFRTTSQSRRRFSLIELLIVIAVIAVLMALLLPALKLAKGKALQAACAGSIKQMGTAISLYVMDYNDWMPLAQERDWVDMPYYRNTWIGKLHEYIDRQPFTKTHLSAVFNCPAGAGDTYTANGKGGNYMYNCFLGFYEAVWGYPDVPQCGPRKLSRCAMPSVCGVLIDGTNNSGIWPAATGRHFFDFCDVPTSLNYMSRRHTKGTNALYADGHVLWEDPAKQTDLHARQFPRFTDSGWTEGYYWPR